MEAKWHIDEDVESADWTRKTWDLPTLPAEFLSVIGGRAALPHFLSLPAARAMPAGLRAALEPLPEPEKPPAVLPRAGDPCYVPPQGNAEPELDEDPKYTWRSHDWTPGEEL